VSERPDDTELTRRIDESMTRIARMAAEGKPPRMSIPVNSERDDDVFICDTFRQVKDALHRAAQDAAVIAKLREWAATMARGRYTGYGLPILPPRNLSRWLAEAERTVEREASERPEAP